jgi:hypothetical protein
MTTEEVTAATVEAKLQTEGAMNDDVEADDEATSVRSQWKRIYSSQ